ncbi:MAG: helix-turn-helix domain-containing protein [Burkholderiaceae bacterium]|nr:helix-turn-helix domain-containing protein [Burkholderiaceae bacterium]
MPTLSLEEAAAMLKTTPETVSDCIHHRGLRAARIGRAYVLVQDDVIDWLRTQYITPEQRPCASTPAAPAASYGLTSPSMASALSAALAPQTSARRRNTPRPLRPVSGGRSGSEKRQP